MDQLWAEKPGMLYLNWEDVSSILTGSAYVLLLFSHTIHILLLLSDHCTFAFVKTHDGLANQISDHRNTS